MGDGVFTSMMGWMCFCWLVPLGMFGVMYGIVNGLSNTWRTRGLERHELYCAACRFNLRGNGSRQCPECGRYADAENILSKGYSPPMTSAARMLFVSMIFLGPVMILVMGAGRLFSFNFEVSRHVTVFDQTGEKGRIELSRDGREGWPFDPEACTMQLFATGAEDVEPYVVTLRPARGVAPAERIDGVAWSQIERAMGIDNREDGELSRRRHVALVEVVSSMDRGVYASFPATLGFEVIGHGVSKRYSPHPVFVLIVVVLSAGVWISQLFVAAKFQRKVDKEDADKRNALIAQLDRWIERNRKGIK